MKIRIDGRQIDVTEGEDIDLDAEEIYVDGERLTEARAEALARDISRRHGAKGGRPPLSAGESENLAFRAAAGTRDRLERLARERHVTRSELIRRAVEDMLSQAS